MKSLLFICFLLLVFSSVCYSWFDWQVIDVDGFSIFYQEAHEREAKGFADALMRCRPVAERVTGNSKRRTPIIIEDIGTEFNGSTDPIFDRITLYTSPPTVSVGLAPDGNMDLAVHEYTHMLHMTQTSGVPQVLVATLGTAFLPNAVAPGFIIEGIAVYAESSYSKYSGRLNDGYYKAYLDARAREGRFPSILEATYDPFGFPLREGHYIYGSLFIDYLVDRSATENNLPSLIEDYGRNYPMLGIGTPFYVFEESLPELWRQWSKTVQSENKGEIEKGQRLTTSGWWKDGLSEHDGKLYYSMVSKRKTGAYKSYLFNEIHCFNPQDGSDKVIVSNTSSFTSSVRFSGDRIFYSVAELGTGYSNLSSLGYGVRSQVHVYDLKKHTDTALFRAPLRCFTTWNDVTIVYAVDRRTSYGSILYRYDISTGRTLEIAQFDLLIDQISSYGDEFVITAKTENSNFNVFKLDIETFVVSKINPTPYLQRDPVVRKDIILYSTNQLGKYDIFTFNKMDGASSRATDCDYSVSPVFDANKNLIYYLGVNGKGYDIYSIQPEYLPYGSKSEQSSTQQTEETMDLRIKKGNAVCADLASLIPKIHVPLGFVDAESTRIGALVFGKDTLGQFSYQGVLGADVKQEEPWSYFTFSTKMLSPVVDTVFYDTNYDYLSNQIYYPVYANITNGLQQVDIDLNNSLFDDNNRHVIRPECNFYFGYPGTNLQFSYDLPVERTNLGSSIKRTGHNGEVYIDQCLGDTAISLDTMIIYDPENPDSPFPLVRGGLEQLEKKTGMAGSLELSASILKLRQGLWFPPFPYLEDVSVVPFYDWTYSDPLHKQFSTGLELHLELHAFSILSFDIGMRVVSTDWDNPTLEPIVTMPDIPLHSPAEVRHLGEKRQY